MTKSSLLVPTLCVGTHWLAALRQTQMTQSVDTLRYHAERGNEKFLRHWVFRHSSLKP